MKFFTTDFVPPALTQPCFSGFSQRWGGQNDPFNGGGSSVGNGNIGSSDGAAQLGYYYVMPEPMLNNDPNWSDIMNAASSTADYMAYVTKNSKTTYALIYSKNVDLPVLKISKKGERLSKIAKTHKIANLTKNISSTLGVASIFIDGYDAIEAYANGDNRMLYEHSIDLIIDVACLASGPIPVAIGIARNWKGRDLFWKYVDSYY